MDGKTMIPGGLLFRFVLSLVFCTLLALTFACSSLRSLRGSFAKDSAEGSSESRTPPKALPLHRPTQVTFQSDTVLHAAVSVDGQRMVYTSRQDGFSTLWIASPDPIQPVLPRQLYQTPSELSSLALSRDGRRVAFVGTDYDAKGDIYILEVDDGKTEPRRLTGRETADGAPCFSPDGKTLYFQQKDAGQSRWHLVSLNLEKTPPQPIPLKVDGDGAFPAISPDGKRCAFVSVRNDPNGDIFLTFLDGKKTIPLTRGPDRDLFPAWSQDGQFIYFSRLFQDTKRDGPATPGDNSVIYRARATEEKLPPAAYPLTSASYPAYHPMTTVSGFYFLSIRRGAGNVWTLPAEGEIPLLRDGQSQMDLAEQVAAQIPRDDDLAVLGYFKVLEAFSAQKPFGGRAAYAIASLYERMGSSGMAEKAFRLACETFADTQPEAALSRLRLAGMNARRDWRQTHILSDREKILAERRLQLQSISAGHPDSPLIQAQSLIEEARLLMDLEKDSQSLLTAIHLLDRVIETKFAPRTHIAEAMVLRTDIFGRVGRAESVFPGYARVVEGFPDVEEWADAAVERILDIRVKGADPSDTKAQTELLARIAEEYRLTIPRLAMGAWNRMGDVYYSADEWAQAKNAYRQVLQGFPVIPTQTAAARLALAEILYREERFRQALDLYEKEMTSRPYEDHLYRLARAAYIRKSIASGEFLYRLGEVPSAQKIFLELIRDDPNNVQAHRGYIKCAAAKRQMPAALTHYRGRLAQDPDDATAIYTVGLCLTYVGGQKALEETRSLIQRAIRRQGQVEYFHQTMGYVLEVLETVHGQSGLLEEALQSYRKAYFLNNPEKDPDNRANLLLNLGNVYFLLGQYGKAFDSYSRRFDSRVPFDNKEAEIQFYRRFGAAAFQIREREEPIQAYSKALDLIEKRIEPKAASEVLGKINSYLFDWIIHPILSPQTEAPIASRVQDPKSIQEAKGLAEWQGQLNRRMFEVSARPVGPPPDPSWLTYKKDLEALIDEQQKVITNLTPLILEKPDDRLQTLSYMIVRAREALDFPERLMQLKAEMLDRLGLAFQEAEKWQQARKAFEQAYSLNEALGLSSNLVGNQRAIAFNAYMEAGILSGDERKQLLQFALKGFQEVDPLIRKYGVATSKAGAREKGGQIKKAVIGLAVDVSLDETTASKAMYGFSADQEERLAQAFISRIQIELGHLVPAQKALQQQLASYPSGGPLPDKDLYGVSLLYHRAGQLSYARNDPLEAFSRFRDSARMSIRLKNPVSAAINVVNMAQILAAMSPAKAEMASSYGVLLALDRQTTQLLNQFSNVLEPSVIPSYHNAMGVFTMKTRLNPSDSALEKAAQQMAARGRACMHFASGLRWIEQRAKAEDRKGIGLSAVLHLNMAELATELGEPVNAKTHLEAALDLAKRGLLPQYEWRALAGLGRLKEALKVIESITILTAGCGPGEITQKFSPLVKNLVSEGKDEEAFNLIERISEIERVNRMTPLVLRPLAPGERTLLGRVYKRLLAIHDLESRLSEAKGSERNYLVTRLAQEHHLLQLDIGQDRERVPYFAALSPSKAVQDRLMILLGISLQAEDLASEAVKAKEPSKAEALRRQFKDLLDQYRDTLVQTGKLALHEGTLDISGLIMPNPVEAMDVMETLPKGATCFRLLTPPDSKTPWMAFVLTSDEIRFKEVNPAQLTQSSKDGPHIVAFEDPSLLPGPITGPVALSATHWVRAFTYRKPFRRTILALPNGDFIPEPFQTRSLPVGASEQDILKALPAINGLVLDAPVYVATSVPTRPGQTPASFIGMELDQGRIFSLDLLSGRLMNVSLAVFANASIKDAYFLGHLFSLFGVSSILLPEAPQSPPPFLGQFFRAYSSASAQQAFQTAREKSESSRAPQGARSAGGQEWLFMGYWGMTSEESRVYAQRNFAQYVRSAVGAFKSGQAHRALILFENALQVATETESLRQYLPDLYKSARESAFASGEDQRAAEYAQALVRIIEKRQPDSEAHADALLKLGLVMARSEKFDQAIPPLEKTVKILANLELDPEKISALADLGVVLENATEYDRALLTFESAASLSKSLNKKELLARQSMRIGRIYDLRLNQYAQAKKSYEEAYFIYKELNQKKLMAQSLLDMGRCYRLLGNFEEAQGNYHRAMDLTQADGSDLRLRANIFMEEANNAWYQARYQEAFDLQTRVSDLAQQNDWPLEKVMALNTSGLIWWTLGDNKRALLRLEEALGIAQTLAGRQDEVATTLNNIGLLHREMGQFSKALQALDQALAIDRKIRSRWAIAYDLRNKALTYLRMGSPEKAIPLFDEALAIASAIGNRINEAKILLGYGEALASSGRDGQAREAYEKAFKLSQAMALREVDWRALYGLALLTLKQGQKSQAMDLLYRSIQVIEGVRAEIKLDQLKDGFITNKMAVYEALVSLLLDLGKPNEAFDISERSRARNLIDLLGNQKLTLKGVVDQELYDRQKTLRSRIREQEALSAQAAQDAERSVYATALERLQGEYKDLMLQIQAKHPELASLVSVDPLRLSEIQHLLDPGVVLMTYYLLPDEILCWLVTRESVELLRTPFRRETLGGLILDYRRMIQNLEPLEIQSKELYSLLLSKVAPRLGKVGVIGIIPHGTLHYLSFATLFDGENYLADRFSLFYLPSASVFRYTADRRKSPRNDQVLAIGNPDLKNPAWDLPFAEREVSTIAWNFPHITLLTKDKATESWVVRNIDRFGIIHLASHGEFDPINPLFSSVKLVKDISADGNLEASEVFGLKISADLVVLSACQTGLGKVTGGDDVIGMNRAFLFAGTHAMISSLWRVSDISTAMLVKHFYRTYKAENKADSLKKAILHVKHRYPHPGYWGAFTLVGDWE